MHILLSCLSLVTFAVADINFYFSLVMLLLRQMFMLATIGMIEFIAVFSLQLSLLFKLFSTPVT